MTLVNLCDFILLKSNLKYSKGFMNFNNLFNTNSIRKFLFYNPTGVVNIKK
jgi:hypothetical protein